MLDPTEPDGVGSPLMLMRMEPQLGQFSAVFEPPIEYGVPENAAKMPLSCHPCTACATGPVLLRMNGRS